MRNEKREMWPMGTVFWTNPKHPTIPSHLFVVISDPAKNGNEIVTVHLTTAKDDMWFDPACVLQRGDHDAIGRPTYARYQHAWVVNGNALRTLSEAGQIHRHSREVMVQPEVLKRLQKGAMGSKRTPARVKGILAEQGLGQ